MPSVEDMTTTAAHAPAASAAAPRTILRQLGIDSAYALLSLPLTIASFVVLVTGLSVGVGLLVLGVGVPILAGTLLAARVFADIERLRIPPVLRIARIRPHYRSADPAAGFWRRIFTPIAQGQSWLDLVHGILRLPLSIISFVLVFTWWAGAIGGTLYWTYGWAIPQSDDSKELHELLGMADTTANRVGLNVAIGLFFLLTLPLIARGAALLEAGFGRGLLTGVAEMRNRITVLEQRRRRRAPGQGPRPGRPGRPGTRHGRHAQRDQPGRRSDRGARGAAVLRVVVADDAVLLREGLVRLLTENGCTVVAAVGDGPALVDAVVTHRPDVSIVDVRMPPSHTDEGLRAAVEARARVPATPILVLSQYVEVSYADDLLADRVGAVGYLLKDRVAAIAEFLDAVRRVAAGGTVLDAEVVAQLLVRRRRDDPLRELTPREREVLALMAEGRSNTAIARDLVVSDGAVEKHIRSIFTKLQLPPDTELHRRVLAVLAYLRG
jgi:DNA-binding NarL/FixJ family response regulator